MSPPTVVHLAHLRALAGRSQRSLAKSCGLSYNVIRRLESGGSTSNVTLGQLDRIASELSCTIADLLEPTESASDPKHPRDLSIAEAKLLRRIHRGENVSSTLSQPERQFILPALINMDLVTMVQGRPEITKELHQNLRP